MNIAAFDLSLTAAGFATTYPVIEDADWGRGSSSCVAGTRDGISSGIIEPEGMKGTKRLRYIRGLVLDIASGADLVVIEGLAFGAKGNAMLDLAGLAAVVRIALADREQPYVDIPPASMKLFATGKGNAPKDEVLACAVRKLDYPRHNHNEADALWLLQMAQMHTGELIAGNEHQRRALAKIVWPEMAHA